MKKPYSLNRLAGTCLTLLLALTALTAQAISFSDGFTGVPVTLPSGTQKLYPDPTSWAFTFWPGVTWPDSYGNGTNWLAGNGECEAYLNPFSKSAGTSVVPAALRYDPFTVQSDGLHIRAQLLSPAQMSAYHLDPYRRFGSGMLLSRFSFTYGQIRIVAKLPSARGTWPAFWLLPDSHAWPPEIDILEGMAWGPHTQQVHAGLLVPSTGTGSFNNWYNVPVNLSQGFHEYGLNWTASTMTGLLDGSVMWTAPTPASMNQNMYLIANLAVGGKWPYNELGVLPIDGMTSDRLNAGSNLIQPDYPADLVIRSITINSGAASSSSAPAAQAVVKAPATAQAATAARVR